jgi:flagellar biosynthetic protein FliR
MEGLEQRLVELSVVFVLLLARIGAMVGTAPLLSEGSLPLRIKALMAVAITAFLTPLSLTYLGDAPLPSVDSLIELGALAASEVIIGIALGLSAMIILAGVQLTGQVIGQMSGMALAEGSDPVFGDNSTVFGQVFFFVTTAVFVAAGGHRLLIEGLLNTLELAPPGTAIFTEELGQTFVSLLGLGFEIGLRTSAPLMVSLFLATLVLGLVSRTMPQINTMVVGFGVNAMLTLGVMMASIGAVAWAFQGPIASAIDAIANSVAAT